MYVIFASYGNDSIALIQWAKDNNLKDVTVVYSDTGWSSSWWPERVKKAEKWVERLGFNHSRTNCEGMIGLIKRKKAWPRGGGGKFQFCTEALKKEPARRWLDENDPEKEATCLTGIRRSESRNRATAPEWVECSPDHGDRELWQPLVRHETRDRNQLVEKSPFEILPYKSKECWPCVNANKNELKHLEPERINFIEDLEKEMGTNSKGNKRVMFSPKKHNGAQGIRNVVLDAKKSTDELIPVRMCESGWCE